MVLEAEGTEMRDWLVEAVCGAVLLTVECWLPSVDGTTRCLGFGGGVGRGLALEVRSDLSAGRGLVLEVVYVFSAGGSSS